MGKISTCAIRNTTKDTAPKMETGEREQQELKKETNSWKYHASRARKRRRGNKRRITKARRRKRYDRHGERHKAAERTSKQTNMEKDRHGNNHPENNTAKNIPGEVGQRFHTKEKEETKKEGESQIVQNDIEYADDTQLLIEKTHMDRCAKE